MDRSSSSFPARQQIPGHWTDSDPQEQLWNPLDSLALESAGLAKWRSLAVRPPRHAGTPWALMDSLDIFQMWLGGYRGIAATWLRL